jgi:(R,R)-butanediol dehydrogenase/meso-butanediol dehydrogenase/diacetyl reductase
VPHEMVHVVPIGVTPHGAAMAEPLAVAWHAVDRAGLGSGQTAAVLGGGPIGIGVYLTLRIRGIEAWIVEPSPDRRAVASRLGARTIDPDAAPLHDQLRDLGVAGVDACFETSGAVASVEAAFGASSKHGRIVLLASPRQPLPPILGQALAKELTLTTSYGYHGDFVPVLEAIAGGGYPMEEWVVTAGLSEIDAVLSQLRGGTLTKALIDPSR